MLRPSCDHPARLTATVCIALTLIVLAACSSGERSGDTTPQLEAIEDLTESAVNDLLLLANALRDGDMNAAAGYIAESVDAVPLPDTVGEDAVLEKWILTHDWSPIDAARRPVSQQEFMTELEGLLGHFSSIDDVMFKMKAGRFDPAEPGRGSARVQMKINGRDRDERREFFVAFFNIVVERAIDDAAPESESDDRAPWRIAQLEIESMTSKVASRDLFSEVASPAGLSARVPVFGEGANQGFKFHGAAVADVDADGLLDLMATGVERNHLYRNLGDGRFEEIGEQTLVAFAPTGTGALFLDHDNDGDADLFMATVGTQMLLENRLIPDGTLRFIDISDRAGVDSDGVGFSAAAADVNGDSYPDIYVSCYNRYGDVMPNGWGDATNGTPNLLFVSNGDGTYREAASEYGVADTRWSYAAGFADLDDDGDQDLYVANDFGVDGFYRNEGGRFVNASDETGLDDPGFGMGVSFGDFDNDGDLDVHVTDMSSTAGKRILGREQTADTPGRDLLKHLAAGNTLYENVGDGTFRNVAQEMGGLGASWAFGGGFVDFDNDGREDIYTPNGFISGDRSMKDT